jgi:hypothetical protein
LRNTQLVLHAEHYTAVRAKSTQKARRQKGEARLWD